MSEPSQARRRRFPRNDLAFYSIPGTYRHPVLRIDGTLKIGIGDIGASVTAYLQTADGQRVAVNFQVLERIL